MTGPAGCAAVVLAGGASRRFGADKLDALVGGARLLDRAVEGLPDDAQLILVGPERPLIRSALHVREEPPGGGPAAAMVAGLRVALEAGADRILVLPGDAPAAGAAASALLRVLDDSRSDAVVGTDPSGFEQPLQLALSRSAASALVHAAGPDGARGGSARRLVDTLDPPALRWPLSSASHFDVDTPEQLQAWLRRDSRSVRSILAAVDELAVVGRPTVVALDGWSGSGQPALAAALGVARATSVLTVADFANAELAGLDLFARERMSDAEVADAVLDWRRLRQQALAPLAAGRPASVRRADPGGADAPARPVEIPPSPLVVLAGVYSGRPELADLVDLAVFVDVDEAVRRRLLGSEVATSWAGFFERGESYYFACVRQQDEFDLRVAP